MSIFNTSNLQSEKQMVSSDAKSNTITTALDKPIEKTLDVNKETSIDKTTTVVLNGPLSKIYSDALNVVYANESYAAMVSDDVLDDNESTLDRCYVYGLDGDNLETSDLIKADNSLQIALDSKKYKKIILAVECSKVNNKVTLLHDIAMSKNIDIVFKRQIVIDNVKRFLI